MAYFIPNPTEFSSIPNLGTYAFVQGLEITTSGATTFTVAPGSARDLTTDWVMSFLPNQGGNGSLIEVDVTKVGVNGCYPFSPIDLNIFYNTIYGVYLIGNSSGTNQDVAVVVATGDNFLPPGYNTYRRIGLIYIEGTSYPGNVLGNINPILQSGSGNDRMYQLQTSRITISTTGTTTSYQQVLLSDQNKPVPPIPGTICNFTWRFSALTAGDLLIFSADGIDDLTASPRPFVGMVSDVSATVQQAGTTSFAITVSPDGEPQYFYRVGTNGCPLQVNLNAFSDSLGPRLF